MYHQDALPFAQFYPPWYKRSPLLEAFPTANVFPNHMDTQLHLKRQLYVAYIVETEPRRNSSAEKSEK